MSRARRAGIVAHAQLPAPCLGNYLTPPSGTPPPAQVSDQARRARAVAQSALGVI